MTYADGVCVNLIVPYNAVLPDFVSWPHKYVIAHFDGDDPIEDLAKVCGWGATYEVLHVFC